MSHVAGGFSGEFEAFEPADRESNFISFLTQNVQLIHRATAKNKNSITFPQPVLASSSVTMTYVCPLTYNAMDIMTVEI